MTKTVLNDPTIGTRIGRLAVLSSGNAVTAPASATSGIIGVVVAGDGKAGSAKIVSSGYAYCAFDGPAIAGDYVVASTKFAGECASAGQNYPQATQCIGQVVRTGDNLVLVTIESVGGASGASVSAAQLLSGSSNDPNLATFHTALGNGLNQLVQWVHFGDSQSINDQFNAASGPTTPGNRWIYATQTALKTLVGDGGTGMVPVYYAVGNNAVNPHFWTVTGTIANDSSLGLGPSQTGVVGAGLANMSSGATLTFTATGDHINIYYATATGDGSATVIIDGVTSGTITGTGATAAHLWTSGSLSNSLHTIVITASGTFHVFAAEATIGTVGLRVHNLSFGSAAAEFWAANFAFSDLIPGSVHLVTTMLQTNEPGTGYSTGSFSTALTSILTHEQGLYSPAPSCLVIVPPVCGIGGFSQLPSYTAVSLTVAAANSAALLNVQTSWGTGNPAVSDPNARFSADHLHPNDKGQLDIAGLVKWQLLSATPASGALQGVTTSGPGTLTLSNLAAAGGVSALVFKEATTTWTAGVFDVTGNSPQLGGALAIYDQTSGTHVRVLANAAGGVGIGGDILASGPDLHTDGAGNAYMGNNTSTTGSATPITLDLGGTFSTVAGANPKLKLFNNGAGVYGLGVSSSQMDFVAPASSGFKFFTAGISTAAIDATGNLTITGLLKAPLFTPASSSAAGVAGQVAWDGSYVYVCTATNVWKRSALATF